MLNVFSLENAHIFRKTSLLKLGFEILALYLYVSLSITQPDFHCNCLKEREKLKRIDGFESNKGKNFLWKKEVLVFDNRNCNRRCAKCLDSIGS